MNKHQSKHQFPWNTCWLAFVSVACARKEYIKGNISSFYARVPEASAAGAKSWDGDHQCLTLLSDDVRCLWKSHHIGQMSHQMSRHMYVAACQDILSYPVVVHDMGLCDVDIYVISGFQGIFAHFCAVFVKMGFCAETSMPGICTSWGWGQQNSAEGHASWSSPRAENFLPAVLLCGRWLEDPGRALRPLRPGVAWGMVAGHLSHLSCSEFSAVQCQADSANNSADYVSPAGLPWTVLESAWHFDVSTWLKYLQY